MQRYRPFVTGPYRLSMGLRALGPAEWIERDEGIVAELALRRRLLAERRAEVLASLPESAAAEAELLELLIDHLVRVFPRHYRRRNGDVTHHATGETFRLADFARCPLELAGRLVQEDFCVMQAGPEGLRLTGAVLCFPSRWRLADKLGRPLVAIHDPVPGFAEQLGPPAERMLERLEVERPVWRVNWSLVDTPELFLPPEHRRTRPQVRPDEVGESLWLRVERQTLRRLPRSQAVVFTIRTYVEPLAEVLDTPDLAATLAARLREMPDAMAGYKNILPIRTELLAWLERRAARPAPTPVS
jgi:dimethylamine monooxygenase subunit A